MPGITVLDTAKDDVSARLRQLREPLLLDRLVLDDSPQAGIVQEIIRAVRARGDEAVAEITTRVDQAKVAPEAVRVEPDTLARAHREAAPALLAAARFAIAEVRRFQEHLMSVRLPPLDLPGRRLALRSKPVRRVGVCVPGASAPLLSSAIHSVVPAQVAGVPEIVIAAPPRHQGDIHPAILAVAHELGVSEVYRMGGSQAIAAMAIGTQRVGRVDKIVGPGNIYGQLAKRFLYGVVDIDMFAGPSEVLIIADDSARPDYLAIDMLAQAEHDPGCAILLTTSQKIAEVVLAELDRQLGELPRSEGARRCLEQYSAIVVVGDLDEAVTLANEIAPEHLEVATRDASLLADRLDSAGAIFVGHFTPESAGDYVAGPSHVLPTGGTARFWSGVSALSFLRRTSVIEYTAAGLAEHAEAIHTLATAENLDAHARSATLRRQKR